MKVFLLAMGVTLCLAGLGVATSIAVSIAVAPFSRNEQPTPLPTFEESLDALRVQIDRLHENNEELGRVLRQLGNRP